MAITHFSIQIIGRADGRSALLSAAYRHCAKMSHESEGRTVDYSNKPNLGHEEFLLPPDAPQWARALIADRSVAGAAEAFWNAVEAAEKRADAQLAKEFIIALPVELSREQNVALMRQFVLEQVLSRGQVADWVYHDEPGNPHVHLMTTLRPLTEKGFGAKKAAVTAEDGTPKRTKNGKIQYRLWAGEKAEFLQQRRGWLDLQNQHLALAGLEVRVDGRSYAERGIDLVPTAHIGAGARAIHRKAQREGWPVSLERIEIFEAQRVTNRERILDRPEIVLDLLSSEMSVFSERDIAKVLHRYVDDPATFQQLMVRILQSPELLRLERSTVEFETGRKVAARYTTRALIRMEAQMAKRAIRLSNRSSHRVRERVLTEAYTRHDKLSDEQRAAIEHITKAAALAAVVGRAGAGKTTMMKAAREAWEAAGYRVVGGALAGKAAEGLENEAGIASRTLASWELSWENDRGGLDAKCVFVLDEAGMVSSRQMALLVEAATRAGAKLVLVGDPDQLQPIEAGAAFRAIVDRVGYAELGIIYRQRDEWMRRASIDLARGQVAAAISAYDKQGMLRSEWTKDDAVRALIDDWNCDYDPQKSSLILAHLRRDVRLLNELAREKLVQRGMVGDGFAFRTEDGARRFDVGDRIVFLKNEGTLGVKNGMLATVVEASKGRIVAEVGEGEGRRQVVVEERFYRNVDHGYATTVHKAQGATVDDVKVLASPSLDRHLTYVALTRHRDAAQLYAGQNEFTNRGGVLVDHGVAPFENNPKNRDSYFVTLDIGEGRQNTIWGVDLECAMKEAAPQIGDRIGLEHQASTTIKLPGGKQVERHSWKVVDVKALAMARLSERLSRDGSKETTLDYENASNYRVALRFAQARGLNIGNVARTLVRDRLDWTIRQKQKLADLAQRLRTFGERLGLFDIRQSPTPKEAKPMVAGIKQFAESMPDMVEEKLQSDPAVAKQWEDVSTRFRYVFADPETAFRAMNFDAVLSNGQTAKATLDRLVSEPESIGPLKGRTGLLAGRSEREGRRVAETNVPALRRDIEHYLSLRQSVGEKIAAEEQALRRRASIDIPALSPEAYRMLERVRDAIDRNDLPAALGFAVSNREIKAEIDGFTKAVAERFGERRLLVNEARTPSGKLFERAAEGMALSDRQKLAEAWPVMRAAQQLAAHERTVEALKQTEELRLSQRQTSALKQ